MNSRTPTSRSKPRPSASAPSPTVSGRWLASAVVLVLLLAAFCAYGTLGLLFWQGQWQLLYHPSRTVSATPASVSLAFDDVRFDVTDTGTPRLDGWWVPVAAGARYATDTVLYLHDGRGSLSDTIPAIAALHALGVNVFAFDYRGFGRSAGSHPSEALGRQDAAAAFTYLTDTRHLPARSIVLYGTGTGAVFAAHLAALFAPAGMILEDPSPAARQVFDTDARAQILPLFLLQREKLDPAPDLVSAHLPRLFLDRRNRSPTTRRLFDASSNPKQYVDLRPNPASEAAFRQVLTRFFDQIFA